jgi:hypothetical protein
LQSPFDPIWTAARECLRCSVQARHVLYTPDLLGDKTARNGSFELASGPSTIGTCRVRWTLVTVVPSHSGAPARAAARAMTCAPTAVVNSMNVDERFAAVADVFEARHHGVGGRQRHFTR